MKCFLPVAILITLITSCGTDPKPKIVREDTSSDEKIEIKKDSTLKQIADLPIHIDSTDYIMYPIGTLKINDDNVSLYKSISYNRDNFTVSNYSGYRVAGNLSNVKFQEIGSNSFTSLTDDTIRINSITFLKQLFDNTKSRILVYEVIDMDSNKDGKLDLDDVKSLYYSKSDGTAFTKLSQDSEEILDWRFISITNTVYFRTLKDANMDGVFDKKDTVLYQYVDFTSKDIKVKKYKPL